MKLLLDTHAFIWWDSAPEKLSPRALSLCEDSANLLHHTYALDNLPGHHRDPFDRMIVAQAKTEVCA